MKKEMEQPMSIFTKISLAIAYIYNIVMTPSFITVYTGTNFSESWGRNAGEAAIKVLSMVLLIILYLISTISILINLNSFKKKIVNSKIEFRYYIPLIINVISVIFTIFTLLKIG